MIVTNLSVLRKNIFSSFDRVIKDNERIIAKTRNGRVVILSEHDYNSMLETIYMSHPNLLKKIKEGEKEDISSLPIYNPKENW